MSPAPARGPARPIRRPSRLLGPPGASTTPTESDPPTGPGLITQGLSATVIILGMMLILLFLGCFVDQVSMMLITLPFFMPLVQQLGVDPIWFGVLFLICMQLGLLTPPFGLLLFTMKGVAPPGIAMNDVFQAALPYVWFGLLALAAVFLFPPLATWLPGLIG